MIGFDTGFYVDGLRFDAPSSVRTTRNDIRALDEADLEGVHAIVRASTRLAQLRHLLHSHRIDERFLWRE